MKMAEVDKVKLRHSLLNRARVDIISGLLAKPRNISELEKQLDINRSTICYHLNTLEEVGILQSKYKILQAAQSKGRAGRIYSINTERLGEAIRAVEELRDELKV